MQIPIEDRIAFLKQRPMFNDVEGRTIAEIARRMDEYTLEEGKNLFSHGDRGSVFYIIYQGSVRTWIEEDEYVRELGILEAGDKIGEEALLLGRPRAVTVTTLEETTFLVMHKPDFDQMVNAYPEIGEYLTTLMESRQATRFINFPWLQSGEVVHIITRRHPAILAVALIKPFVVTLIALLSLYFSTMTRLDYVPRAIAFVLFGVAAIWSVWEVLEWRNDYFILTNQRVVWLEQVILQAAARREAPLAAVQSVDVKTSMIGRMLNFGNVFVRTFTGTGSLTLTDVNRPDHMKKEIEELLLRVRVKAEVTVDERIRYSIRQSLGMEAQEVEDTTYQIIEIPEEEKTRFKLLRTREVSQDGLTITYHRHWWVLLGKTWLPLLGLIGMLAVLISALLNQMTLAGVVLRPFSFLAIWLIGTLVLLLIIAYHFADWRNDIYKINKDNMLIDSEKKPFGEEISRTAPIKNILSLEHQRTGILRLLLNFGDVRIVVADATLTFHDVHNPAMVQQDIYYRQEQIKIKNEEAEMEAESKNFSRWLKAYHDVYEEQQTNKNRRFAADFEDEQADESEEEEWDEWE